MSAASDYLEVLIGNHLFRTSSWTKPTELWVALFTTLPDDTGANGVEVGSGLGYARVANHPSDTNWSGPTSGNGQFANEMIIQFGTPSNTWGTIVGFGLYDAQTSGNLLIKGSLDQSLTVVNGDPGPSFPIGRLKVTLS